MLSRACERMGDVARRTLDRYPMLRPPLERGARRMLVMLERAGLKSAGWGLIALDLYGPTEAVRGIVRELRPSGVRPRSEGGV